MSSSRRGRPGGSRESYATRGRAVGPDEAGLPVYVRGPVDVLAWFHGLDVDGRGRVLVAAWVAAGEPVGALLPAHAQRSRRRAS